MQIIFGDVFGVRCCFLPKYTLPKTNSQVAHENSILGAKGPKRSLSGA